MADSKQTIQEQVNELTKRIVQIESELEIMSHPKIVHPAINQYKVIYTKGINIDGKYREPGRIFLAVESQELRNLVKHKYVEFIGEADD